MVTLHKGRDKPNMVRTKRQIHPLVLPEEDLPDTCST